VNDFVSGALVMGYVTVGLFFLRFYRQTRDALFVFFALAFGLLASSRFALSVLNEESEQRHYLYWLRLAAFVLLLVGIIRKNRGR
jgi:hypothetical protein